MEQTEITITKEAEGDQQNMETTLKLVMPGSEKRKGEIGPDRKVQSSDVDSSVEIKEKPLEEINSNPEENSVEPNTTKKANKRETPERSLKRRKLDIPEPKLTVYQARLSELEEFEIPTNIEESVKYKLSRWIEEAHKCNLAVALDGHKTTMSLMERHLLTSLDLIKLLISNQNGKHMEQKIETVIITVPGKQTNRQDNNKLQPETSCTMCSTTIAKGAQSENKERIKIRACNIRGCNYIQKATSGNNMAAHYRRYHTTEDITGGQMEGRFTYKTITTSDYEKGKNLWQKMTRQSRKTTVVKGYSNTIESEQQPAKDIESHERSQETDLQAETCIEGNK